MIRSFGDARTQALFQDEFVRYFQGIARPAKRRLEAISAFFVWAESNSPQEDSQKGGVERVTADTALRLSLYFGNSPEFWINLQSHYDLKVARSGLKPEDIKRIKAQRAA